MDGLQATGLLKRDETTRAIPVIALTALAMKGGEEMRYQDLLTTVAAQLEQT